MCIDELFAVLPLSIKQPETSIQEYKNFIKRANNVFERLFLKVTLIS